MNDNSLLETARDELEKGWVTLEDAHVLTKKSIATLRRWIRDERITARETSGPPKRKLVNLDEMAERGLIDRQVLDTARDSAVSGAQAAELLRKDAELTETRIQLSAATARLESAAQLEGTLRDQLDSATSLLASLTRTNERLTDQLGDLVRRTHRTPHPDPPLSDAPNGAGDGVRDDERDRAGARGPETLR